VNFKFQIADFKLKSLKPIIQPKIFEISLTVILNLFQDLNSRQNEMPNQVRHDNFFGSLNVRRKWDFQL